MKQAFRQPGFPRLYAGLTASMFGDSAMLLVLSMWVKTLTGSNAQAGLTFFFMAIPALLAPLLGVGIDRVRRKPLLVWGHVASGVLVLPLVLVRGAGPGVAHLGGRHGLRRVVRRPSGCPERPAQGAPARGDADRRQRVPADHQGVLPALRSARRRAAVHLARRVGGGRARRRLLLRRGARDRLPLGARGAAGARGDPLLDPDDRRDPPPRRGPCPQARAGRLRAGDPGDGLHRVRDLRGARRVRQAGHLRVRDRLRAGRGGRRRRPRLQCCGQAGRRGGGVGSSASRRSWSGSW